MCQSFSAGVSYRPRSAVGNQAFQFDIQFFLRQRQLSRDVDPFVLATSPNGCPAPSGRP